MKRFTLFGSRLLFWMLAPWVVASIPVFAFSGISRVSSEENGWRICHYAVLAFLHIWRAHGTFTEAIWLARPYYQRVYWRRFLFVFLRHVFIGYSPPVSKTIQRNFWHHRFCPICDRTDVFHVFRSLHFKSRLCQARQEVLQTERLGGKESDGRWSLSGGRMAGEESKRSSRWFS